MTESNEICVERNYGLTSNCHYIDECEYPDWLIELRESGDSLNDDK